MLMGINIICRGAFWVTSIADVKTMSNRRQKFTSNRRLKSTNRRRLDVGFDVELTSNGATKGAFSRQKNRRRFDVEST